MGFVIDVQRLRTQAASAARPARPTAASQSQDGTDPYASFQRHYDTLLAHGLTEGAAFDIAEAVCLERERGGDRHVCALECRHHRRGCCMKSRSAGVPSQLGELAFIPQRCPAFVPAATNL